ncbi:MAG: hypothetical protein KAH23_03055 [Kiritimatiellae bacterium]|nr:hypothetical protein [Kiritimatiellia bacterium]
MKNCLIIMSVVASILAAHAQDAEAKITAENYKLEKGVFTVPLRVDDNIGIIRKAWPTTFGVPIPLGLVKETSDLRLLDKAGKEVPCQFKPLSRWWGRDNSLRWVLLDFQADVPAKGSTVYTLTNDKPAAKIKNGINVKESTDAFTLATGKLKVVISKTKCNLFDLVSIAGKTVIKADKHDGPRATTDAQDFTRNYGGDWNHHGWAERQQEDNVKPIKRANYFGDVGMPDRVALERSGPLHVIVRVDGGYRPTKEGPDILKNGPYNFTYRVHIYKDKSFVRVEHSVENSRFQEPRYQTKLLDQSIWSSLTLKGDIACTYGNSDGKIGEGLIKAGKTFSIHGEELQKNKIQWLDLSNADTKVGVTTWLYRDTMALDVIDGKIAIRPYSIYYGEKHTLAEFSNKAWGAGGFQLDFGSRETYNLYYRFGKGDGIDLAELTKQVLWPLFGFAPPAWYADSEVWNMDLYPNHPSQRKKGGKKKPETSYNPYTKSAVTIAKRGKWNFNSGGHHGNLSSLNDAVLMRSDLQALQKNYWITDNAIDFLQWNYRGHEPTNDPKKLHHAHQMLMFGPKDLNLYGKRGQNMGTSFMAYKYLPDFEHYALLWLWEHYYLWGDERAKESLMRFANYCTTFEWDVMFKREEEKNGIPPLDKVDFLGPNHGEALTRSHYARIYSWMLYTPLQAYQATGHPVYDLITKWQLRRMSHLQRLSRGMPEKWKLRLWDSKKQGFWKDIKYPTDKPEDYMYSGKIWMFSKTMIAFHEAYRTYGDEEILDNLWGMCDYYRNQVPWKPGIGTPQIPVVPMSRKPFDKYKLGRGGKFQYHMRTCQGYALAYLYTGDAKLKTMMEDYGKGSGWNINGTWGHMYHWVKARKAGHEKLPDKITDLKCHKAQKNNLVFQWTAPKAYGKSGKAARYFLKYSNKPLVQWAPVSNPDAPEDPYMDKNKRLFKSECWHPDFLKKDAWWMGTHVAGEPTPGEPGKKESCTITVVKPFNYYGLPLNKMPKVQDLPAGTYYFALCSYDEDMNLSDMSNVVKVKLK